MNDELISQLIALPNTYLGEAPIEKDSCQWIRLSSGASKTFFGLKNIDSPEYTLYVRDPSNRVAANVIQDCYTKLQNWTDESKALRVSRLPSYVGRDDKHRSVYTLRVQFIVGG